MGQLPGGVRRCPGTLLTRGCSLVRDTRQPQVVPELGRLSDSHRDDGGNEVDLSQPAPRHPGAQAEPAAGGLKWQPSTRAQAQSSERPRIRSWPFWSAWATWFAVPCTPSWDFLLWGWRSESSAARPPTSLEASCS